MEVGRTWAQQEAKTKTIYAQSVPHMYMRDRCEGRGTLYSVWAGEEVEGSTLGWSDLAHVSSFQIKHVAVDKVYFTSSI